jgi:holliday junction DNA helicase RuvA
MIYHLEGRLVEKTPTYAVIDCGGVGYIAHISLNTYSKIGKSENCKLYTHLAIREDAHILFGFADTEERNFFRHLISVSGVGPSTARMILSSLSPKELYKAIAENNVNALKSIKGIGPKSAQRIIIDLKDKLQKEEFISEFSPAEHNTKQDEALSALVALGIDKNSAGQVLKKVAEKEGDNLPLEILVKAALRYL